MMMAFEFLQGAQRRSGRRNPSRIRKLSGSRPGVEGMAPGGAVTGAQAAERQRQEQGNGKFHCSKTKVIAA